MKIISFLLFLTLIGLTDSYEQEYRIMGKNIRVFEKCYKEILVKNCDYDIRIDIEFVIEKGGNVSSAQTRLKSKRKLRTRASKLKRIERCVSKKVKAITFPEFDKYERKTIKYNLILSEGSSCEHSDRNFSCVTYINNSGGVSIVFDIPNMPAIIGREIPVRIGSVAVPLLEAEGACEKKLAKKLKLRIDRILADAKRIDLVNVKRGKFFKIVADVLADGSDIKDILMGEKLLVPLRSAEKGMVDWCNVK